MTAVGSTTPGTTPPTSAAGHDAVLSLDAVSVVRDGAQILSDVNLVVHGNERWIVLGANGSGKTTLVRIMALYDHPSRGAVEVLGETLGRTDVRTLRRHVGYMSAAFADELRPGLTAYEVVMTAKNAALEPWWHRYDDADRQRAVECLDAVGVGALADRTFGSLSSGERQRVLLARTRMNDPALVLLDEPSSRLDLGGREELLATLQAHATEPSAPAFVLVTHHVEEIPPAATHVLLLRAGAVVTSGPIDRALSAASLSECFGLDLALERRAGGRFAAFAR